ncbi:MAG: MaoC/PaaZ C-terminal domain-containing protein, partial [Burkholderiales bacterium]
MTVRTIAGDDADRFAQISGDLNPIHLDAEFAAATPFGRRVGGSNPLTPTTQT